MIQNSFCEKLSSVKFDHHLTFDQHVKRLKAFARAIRYMGLAKKEIKNEFFFDAKFNYCQLI